MYKRNDFFIFRVYEFHILGDTVKKILVHCPSGPTSAAIVDGAYRGLKTSNGPSGGYRATSNRLHERAQRTMQQSSVVGVGCATSLPLGHFPFAQFQAGLHDELTPWHAARREFTEAGV